jgi:hypothetical protein
MSLTSATMMERVSDACSGSPTPQAWLNSVLREICASSSGASFTSLSAPRPVVMP